MNSETKFHVSVMDARLKKVKKQCDQYKKAYQHCVDDLIVLRANNKRLERENENLKQSVSEYKDYAESHVANYLELKALEHENKALRLQSDTYFDEWQEAEKQRDQYKAECERLERQNAEQLALLKEFRKLIDYKLTLHQGSSMYREYRSKLDQLGVK